MIDVNAGDPVPEDFKSWFRVDDDHFQKWQVSATLAYAFVAGDQWSEDEQQTLKEQLRPIVTFNRVGVVVDSVHGHEIGNQREVRFIPREQGDVKANELLTGAGHWFRDESYADDEESDAFLDMVVAGMGWTETRLDYEEAPDGKPTVDRIDPFEMRWDYQSSKRNLRDSRRRWRVRVVPLKEAQALFPDASVTDLDALWTAGADENNRFDKDSDGADANKNVTIVQCQWKERVQVVRVLDPLTGENAEMSVEEFEVAQERMAQFGVALQGELIRKRVVRQAFLGSIVLSIGDAPCPDNFSLQCMTGKRDRNANQFYGVVRSMIDPQRWANKWLSQLMHIMNSNAKGGLLAEDGAFTDITEAEDTWARPDAITKTKKGALQEGRVQFKPQAALPAGFQMLTEFAVSSIPQTSGVNFELMGTREATQAASLEMQRRQAGMTILQPMFKSLQHYREMQGRVVLHYLTNDMADGRLVRIGGQGSEQYLPLMRQADVQYDIIVDDMPTSPNQKEAAWALLMQVMPTLGNAIPPQVLLTLLEYSPLPSNVVEKIQGQIAQLQQQQAPMQQAQMAMAQEKHQAETAKTASEVEENQADAAYTAAKAQREGLETAATARALMSGIAL